MFINLMQLKLILRPLYKLRKLDYLFPKSPTTYIKHLRQRLVSIRQLMEILTD